MLSASDSQTAYTWTYDVLGRATQIDNQGSPALPHVVLDQAFDAMGARTRLVATVNGTADFENTYQRDQLGRTTRIEQTSPAGGNAVADKRIDLEYNGRGQFTKITRWLDLAATQMVVRATYDYNVAGLLTRLAYDTGDDPGGGGGGDPGGSGGDSGGGFKKPQGGKLGGPKAANSDGDSGGGSGSGPLIDYTWTYDGLSRVVQFVSSSDGTVDYVYDDTSQLTGADYDYQSDETYSYDGAGNRTLSGYQTGVNNRLTSDGTYNYAYDDEGNRISRTEIATGAVTEYTWDHRNRLTKIVSKDAQGQVIKTVDYVYDALDRRIKKTITPQTGPAEVEQFAYDGQHIILRWANGNLANRYLHGPAVDMVLADEQLDGATGQTAHVYWLLADQLGTVRDVAEYDELLGLTQIVNHIAYDAYGAVTSETNAAVDTIFGFTGREMDAESDLYYYRARYYDPGVGRFTSEDPLGFAAGDVNLNRYVGNGPTNATDPSGLWEWNPFTWFKWNPFTWYNWGIDWSDAVDQELAVVQQLNATFGTKHTRLDAFTREERARIEKALRRKFDWEGSSAIRASEQELKTRDKVLATSEGCLVMSGVADGAALGGVAAGAAGGVSAYGTTLLGGGTAAEASAAGLGAVGPSQLAGAIVGVVYGSRDAILAPDSQTALERGRNTAIKDALVAGAKKNADTLTL